MQAPDLCVTRLQTTFGLYHGFAEEMTADPRLWLAREEYMTSA